MSHIYYNPNDTLLNNIRKKIIKLLIVSSKMCIKKMSTKSPIIHTIRRSARQVTQIYIIQFYTNCSFFTTFNVY